jgi:hypothetical protein
VSTLLLVTSSPDLAEYVQADGVERSGQHLLLTRWICVLDQPRQVVARRVLAAAVVAVVPMGVG